ncbi:hypothetical protein LNK15_02760 [Jeotgalicoccus huakuii]|nr:hypothetical protein [Jeotgalicoccus huakuii]
MKRLLKRVAIFAAPIIINKIVEKFMNKGSKDTDSNSGTDSNKKSKRK